MNKLSLILSLALVAIKEFVKNPKKNAVLKTKLEQVRDAIDTALAAWD